MKTGQVLQQVYSTISIITGHEIDDLSDEMSLDTDLGMDSIKTVELFNQLAKLLPVEQVGVFNEKLISGELLNIASIGDLLGVMETVSKSAESHRSITNTVNKAALQTQVFEIVSSITGHESNDLDSSMYLEQDLGLDSIKTVDLISQLANLLPEDKRKLFNEKLATGELLRLETLAEMIDLLADFVSQDSEIVKQKKAESSQGQLSENVSGETVDILYAQYPFLISHWASSYCSLVSRFRFKGLVQTGIIREVWQQLLNRHPMLRSCFNIPADTSSFLGYQLQIKEEAIAPPVDVVDLRLLEKQAQEKTLFDKSCFYLNYQWSLTEWPLHGFFLYQLNDDCYELLFCNHHLISDGLSNQQIMREFMLLYRAIETEQSAQLPAAVSATEIKQLVKRINDWHQPEQEQQFKQFSKQQGRDSFFWDPLKTAKPSNHFADSQFYFYSVNQQITEALLTATRVRRLPMNSLLLGAYLKTVMSLAPLDETVIINIPTSGRVYPEVDASDIIACFAQNLSLSFEPELIKGSWVALLDNINSQIQKAIAAAYDKSQIRQTALAIQKTPLLQGKVVEPVASLVRASLKSNLYMPYTGQTHMEKGFGAGDKTSALELIDYHAITGTNTGTLDTIIEIFAGELNITSNYDAHYFTQDFIKTFADIFTLHLEELANETVADNPALEAENSSIEKYSHSKFSQRLIDIFAEVIFKSLTVDDLKKDLEAELGLDSLERIRIVTRIQQLIEIKVDPGELLDCRSLGEMIELLDLQTESIPKTSEVKATEVLITKNELSSTEQTAWHSIPIPYLQIIEQCKLTPDAVAVLTDEGVSLSYAELNKRSNQLAHYLRSQHIGAGSLVGVMLHRNENLLIAILGILKAGGAYVPLDPNYPLNRLAYISGHAKISIILTEQVLHEQAVEMIVPEMPLQTLVILNQAKPVHKPSGIEVFGNELLSDFPVADLDCVNSPDDLMVVLYTSGSTGVPKGVALAHRGYMNRFQWHQDLFPVKVGDRVGQKTSICFDISVWELFWPLMLGATVCPVSAKRVKNPWKLAQWMEDFEINIMHFVPSLFGEFINSIDFKKHRFSDLRWLIFSGEALPVPFIQKWMDNLGKQVGLANLYGPTEASIDVSAYVIDSRPEGTSIPIGYTMPQVYLRVLDKNKQILPVDTMGELWIGGLQLAQGYLFDPERTEQSFHSNPFPDEIPGKYLYRTGDLAVELPDGSFDYRGRIDSQIKIRGFRVELGEVDAALMTQSSVIEAATLAIDYGNGQIRLWAWLAGEKIDDQSLREALSERLPEYMVPHRFSWLASLPKNSNGKLDRNQLREFCDAEEGTPQVQQRTEQSISEPASPELDDAEQKFYPLAPAQKWLVHFFDPPYQWAGFSSFRFLRPLSMTLFEQTIRYIIKRHPALCAVYEKRAGQWQQRFIQPDGAMLDSVIHYLDGRQLSKAEQKKKVKQQITEVSKSLRLDSYPLWHTFVMAEADDCYSITTIGHHMTNDLLGSDIIFKETLQVYEQLSKGLTPSLSRDQQSFKDYLDKLETLEGLVKKSAVDFWKAQFPSREYSFHIPVDHRLGANVEASESSETYLLSKEQTQALQQIRRRYDCSLYVLLLAPLYVLMSEWSRQPWVVLSHRMHGRDLGTNSDEGSASENCYFGSVGNFAVNFPVGISLDKLSWMEITQQLKSFFAKVPLNGVSFDWVGEELPSYCYPDNNLTPVRANFLGNRSMPTSPFFEFESDEVGQRYSLAEQSRISLMEVFFMIVDEQIHIEWSYSKNFHQTDTIKRLGEDYKKYIQCLLDDKPPFFLPSQQPNKIETAKPLADKTAIVTGASRGIGRYIALRLAKQGARLVLVARSKPGLDDVAAEIANQGGEAMVIPTDICQLEQVEAMLKQVVQWSGGVDILINNAGLTEFSSVVDSDPAQWRSVIETNLFGTYYCCRTVLPIMMQGRQGKIINIGADASHISYPLFSAYSSSKHGQLGFAKSLAEEVKSYNIQVNTVCPAAVDNEGQGSLKPESVADAVAFLVSNKADSITGQHINVFGQQDMYWFGSEKMQAVQQELGKGE